MAEEAVAVKGDSNTTVFIPAHQKERFLSSPFLKQFGVDLINAIIQKAPTIKIWLTDWSKAADDDIEFIYNFLSENGYHDIRIRRQGNKIVLPVDQFKEVTNLSPEMIQTSTQSAVNKVISGSR